MKKVISKDGKEKGNLTGGLAFPCKLEGCRGKRIGVRWGNGKITFPCSSGMKILENGDYQIQ